MSHHSRHHSYNKRDHDDNSNDSREDRKRKRKSRWGNNETDKVVIPGLPTIMPSNLTKEQEEMYLLNVQIEVISHKLRTGDLGIPEDPEQRSPSPEPIYNSDGKRLNTREFRVRKKLEDERHQLITQMITLNPGYKVPVDYKPPQTKLSDKVLIPQEEYPDINFVGLLIGPRGNTLKAMEKDTGAKIIIRGKGSIKEGKIGRKDGQPLPGEDEPLHAFLTAPTEGAIQAATRQIMKIIKQAIELPENQNNLRRTQLRELALLNGTLRENDSLSKRFCSNCGSVEHRNWQCPEKTNMVNTMHCNKCNGKGHLEKDCKFVAPDNGADLQVNQSKIDEEYFSFMAELGECSPPPTRSNANSSTSASVSNSNTTVSDGGPLALTYDKLANNEVHSTDSNQNGSSNGQALLPTPGNTLGNSNSSSSEKSKKTVTWIQKQGQWKQVIQDSSEPSSTDQIASSTQTNDSHSSNGSSVEPASTSDPMAISYYNAYLQQALASGQDYNTAMATAQAAYESYVAYAAYATAASSSAVTDSSASSKYSQAYNAVPPTSQLSTGPSISSSSSNPTASYGYGALTQNSTAASNYSAYAAYYGLGSASSIPQPPVSQPPPPPE